MALRAALPFTPLAAAPGFAPLPPGYFAFLIGAVATYLALVARVERRVTASSSGSRGPGLPRPPRRV